MGATVKYRPLDGREARITGTMSRAAITINESSGPCRRRFSLGHELGHWRHHRGQSFECKSSDIGSARDYNSLDPERVADRFAADLLMPVYMFKPMARAAGQMTIDAAEKLAGEFDVSVTAAAIRLVEYGPALAMLVCHGPNGRKWFRRHPELPEFFPPSTLDPDTIAKDVFDRKTDRTGVRKVGADAWTQSPGAKDFELVEQTRRISEDILTMVWWRDESQIHRELRRSSRRPAQPYRKWVTAS